MFEIPDDDLWSDDFPLDDFVNDGETASSNKGTSSNVITVNKVDLELSKQDDNVHFKTFIPPDTCKFNRVSTKKDNSNSSTPAAEELTNPCKRKFPGPAGVLPPYSPELDKKSCGTPVVTIQQGSTAVCELKSVPHQLSWSQEPADDIFASPQWKALISDLGENAQSLLNRFSIKSSLIKANRKLLSRGKIPLIIGVMDGIEMQGSDASFVLRDPSGKMNGALHRDLFKEPSTALQAGSVLILRRVSVISPSNRTHYLNITPANVALIYTANREAVVSKRPWCTSESLTSDKLTSQDSEMHLLNQIIEDSQQEMSNFLGNLHQGLETCTSPLLGSGETLFNTSLTRGRTPSFSPRTPLSLQRHKYNFKPFDSIRNNALKEIPLFTPVPSLTQRAQIRNHMSTPSCSSNSDSSFRQPLSKNANPTGCTIPLDQCRSVDIVSAKTIQVSPTSHLYHKLDMNSPVTKNILQVSSTTDLHAAFQKRPSLDMDKTPSNLNSFKDDFSDTDDEMMLQMCDDSVSQTVTEGQSLYNREFSRRKEIFPSLVNKAFEDCRNENQIFERIFSNQTDVVCKTNSPYSSDGSKSTSTGSSHFYFKNNTSTTPVVESSSNLPVLSKTSNVAKKFSFKRCNPSSQSPQTPLTTKRPMFEVADKITINSNQGSFSNRTAISMDNLHKVSDKKNNDISQRDSLSSPAVVKTFESNALSAVKPFKSIASHSSVKPTTHYVQPSEVNLSTKTLVGADMISHETGHDKSVIKSNEASERLCIMQSAKRESDSTSTDQIFSLWGDDLTDDLILSQLSDDF